MPIVHSGYINFLNKFYKFRHFSRSVRRGGFFIFTMHYGRNEAVSTVDFRQEIVILCERLIPAVIDIRIIRMKDLPD